MRCANKVFAYTQCMSEKCTYEQVLKKTYWADFIRISVVSKTTVQYQAELPTVLHTQVITKILQIENGHIKIIWCKNEKKTRLGLDYRVTYVV